MAILDEISAYSIDDLELILGDQADLYSELELEIIRDRITELKNVETAVNPEPILRPIELRCPKCDGMNSPVGERCIFCDYKFRERDFTPCEEDKQTEESESSRDAGDAPYYVVSTLFPFVGFILGSILIGKDEESRGKALLVYSAVIAVVSLGVALIILK